MKLTTGSARSH